MSTCLGCQRCEDSEMVLLANNELVCNRCPAWLLECEARHWIDWVKRRSRKDWEPKKLELIKSRGKESVDKLTAKMNELRKFNG